MNLMERIKRSLDTMTKSEAKIAAYCMSHSNEFVFHTLETIAKQIDTSTTSVIRFCQRLGFSGYKSFQEELRLQYKQEPDLPDKWRRTAKAETKNELLIQTLRQSVQCIDKTFRELSPQALSRSISLLMEKRRVFTFGMKESYALAHYAYTRFLTVRKDVFLLNAGYNGELESVLGLTREDVCVVFLFHRYTRQALNILELIKKQGCDVILVTSPPFDSVQKGVSVTLPCFVDAQGIKNSSVAPVCLIDYLCNAVATELGEQALSYMKQSEQLFSDYLF